MMGNYYNVKTLTSFWCWIRQSTHGWKCVLFVVFFWSFRQSFWHLHLQLQRWNQENIYIFLSCLRLPFFGFTRDPMFCNFTLPSATAMFIGFFWSCYHRFSLYPWLKALPSCDFQSPKVLLWPMGFRWHTTPFPRRKVPRFGEFCGNPRGGKRENPMQSWDILMRIMILEYETILGVSGYNLMTCFHKWMWKSLQAVRWGIWNHHLIFLEPICFKTSRSCFSQVVAFGTELPWILPGIWRCTFNSPPLDFWSFFHSIFYSAWK